MLGVFVCFCTAEVSVYLVKRKLKIVNRNISLGMGYFCFRIKTNNNRLRKEEKYAKCLDRRMSSVRICVF